MSSHRLPLGLDTLANRAARLGINAETAFLAADFDEAKRLEALALDARDVLRKAVADDLGDHPDSEAVSQMTGNALRNALRNAYASERAGGAK